MANVSDLLVISELLDLLEEGGHVILAHMLEGEVPELFRSDVKGLMAGAVLVSSVVSKEDIVSEVK